MSSSEQVGLPLNSNQSGQDSEANERSIALPFDDWLEPVLVATTLISLLLGVTLRGFGVPEWVITALAVISYVAGGSLGLIEGISSLREGQINVDLLMILAAVGAAIIGSWPEGATLLFLFSFSNLLQTYAMDRSRKAIRSLLDLRPNTAIVRRDGSEVEVPIEDLQIGEVIVVRPGESIAIDGIVSDGESSVDQASITGESIPALKRIGDTVFAGTINQNGSLEIQVSRRSEDTTLARIIQMVEEAQTRRAPTQRFIDTFEQYYAITVIVAVALFIALPVVIFRQPFTPTFYRAMVLLVVASPCALVISTPASILSAIANAARRGILFKGGVHLENAATIRVIAFDKTGTLTFGRPVVTDILPTNDQPADSLLALTASVESRSEHPLAQAVIKSAAERGLQLSAPSEFQAKPGLGVRAVIGEQPVLVGSSRYIEEQGQPIPDQLATQIAALEAQGKTTLVIHDGGWAGVIAVADEIRPEARHIVASLRSAGVARIVMLTGDNERVAKAIAKEVGVDQFHAALLPQDKVAVVKQLEADYGSVAMVGDGVNDAPALAVASVGIAMGAAGTDVALETADVVLMSDDLNNLPYLIGLSKQARRVVWQNIAFALGVIVMLILGAFGIFGETLPLPLGVVGHEGSTVIVVFNGLRLLAFSPRRM